MGLCKCKVVTNQFCFEHKVNVCEYCMVKNHPKCIVQSYLLWLNDSDYSPLCQLCNQSLADKECIRLLCYHVFHWSCLDNYARRLPAHTAPAGYSCPTCQAPMFPPSNMVSPVADVLRSVLAGVNWARAGLGLPVLEEMMARGVPPPGEPMQEDKLSPRHVNHTPVNALPAAPQAPPSAPSVPLFSTLPSSSHRSSANYDTRSQTESLLTRRRDDRDENKYRRKSPFELLHHWLRSAAPRRRDPLVVYKRWLIVGVIGFVVFCTLVMIMSRLGRAATEGDPMLDPLLNPNIHVQDNNPAADS